MSDAPEIPLTPEEVALRKRLDPIGVAWLVWSAFRLMTALLVIVMGVGFAGLLAMLPPDSGHPGDPPPLFLAVFFGGVLTMVGAFIALISGLGIAVGMGLRKGQQWAMYGALGCGFMLMLNFPVGVALAVWSFVVILPELTRPKA